MKRNNSYSFLLFFVLLIPSALLALEMVFNVYLGYNYPLLGEPFLLPKEIFKQKNYFFYGFFALIPLFHIKNIFNLKKYPLILTIIAIHINTLFYGFFIGDVPLQVVLRNFFGTFVLAVPLFLINTEKSKSAYWNTLLLSSHFANLFLAIASVFNIEKLGLSYAFSRTYYNEMALFPILSFFYGFHCLVNSPQKKVLNTLLQLVVIGLAVFNLLHLNSKIIFLLVILLVALYYPIKKYHALISTHFSKIVIIALTPLALLSFVKDKEIRLYQLYSLVIDSMPLGNGLGSGLKNLLAFDPNFSYAFEMTMGNIIHKYGVNSFFIFFLIYLVFRSSLVEFEKRESFLTFTCSAAILILSLSNPMLFAPLPIFLLSFFYLSTKSLKVKE
ncbi:putative membrane protein [Bacteriovorax sp. BSW11_IV]|uniref:hypothetical protein n=1 Tax=Bacteriovorax sp. BSW11_IV TaxID=1353529 RepID=UPI00038A0B55|nr:hypothetical protein [Bacteriovorax sp. BSW11_IV]EQC45846.1 putative membrane protein [Bacteriovorax sp. BSW11_IV]